MKRYLYQCLLMAVVLAISLSSVVQAGDDVDKKAQNLPRLLGSTNVGTEFYMTFLTAWPQPGGINNIKVYVSSGVETEVVLEVKGQGYVQKKKTKPNDIIEFVLPVTIAQPYFKTDRDPTPKENVYRQQAVHIVSKDPIIVYGVTRYQYTSDGFLAIPVSSLGKEYIVASYGDVGDNGTSFGQYMPSQSFIVAAYDNTKVAFTLGGNLITRTPGGMKPGETKSWNLQKGDVLALASFGKAADLSGSKIVASRPVGVVSGNFCAYIPNKPIETGYCDVTEEMELPTNTWGKSYHVTKIFGRQKNSIIKIFAKEPDTKIYINGQHKNTIATAGGLEGIGYIERRPDEGEPGNFIISGDKPISVQQYNPGQDDDGISSDPFQIVLTPIEQFMHEITFNTPGIGDGSGFARNYINVVFQLDEKRQMPEGLEFAEVSNSKFEWQSIGGRFGSFFDSFTSDVEGKAYGMKTIKLAKDGVYKIRSPYPFTAYAYGFSDYDSYGFPTSVALGDLERPDTVPPVVIRQEKCDGCYSKEDKVTVTDKPDDEDIRSNLAVARLDETNSYNYSFSLASELVAGETISIGWNACPIDKSKEGRAILVFVDRAGNQTLDTIIYKPFSVSILPENPVTLDFGVLRLGNSSTQKLTIRNNSEAYPVTISKLQLANTGVGFDFATPVNLPFTLDPVGGANNSKEIEIKFTANVASEDIDPKDGKLDPFRTDIIVGNECSEIKKPMQAIVGEPVIYANDADFGTLPVNAKQTKVVIIENRGKTPLTVTGMSKMPSNPAYTIVAQPPYPVTIQPGDRTVTFSVQFAPTIADIDYPDDVKFASDAGENIKPISYLTGRAVAPGLFVTDQSWEETRIDLEAGSKVDKTITLKNTGSDKVSILMVTAEDASTGAGNHFIIQPGIVGNPMADLAPDEERTITVTFNPKELGNHEYHLRFKNNAGEDKIAKLTGTGVFAALSTENPVTFPRVNLTTGPATSVKDVTFTAATGEFARGIEVTGFSFDNPTSHFSYNVDPRTEIWANGVQIAMSDLPVVIQPGQTLQFKNAVYAPTAAAAREEAHLTAITTDNTRIAQAGIDTRHTTPELARPVSDWNGSAVIDPTGQGIVNATPITFPETCVNGTATNLSSDVTNVGDADITVETITLEDGNGNPVSGEFTIIQTPPLPLTLVPNATAEKVEIGFTPAGTGARGPVYIIFRDKDGAELARARVNGSADEFETTIQLSRASANDVQPGGDFELTVKNSTTIAQLGAFRKLRVTISYDGTVVKGTSVTPTGNYTISGEPKENGNSFTFDLVAKNPGGVFNAEDLAVVKFTAFLAPSKLTQLTLAVSEVDADCITINGSGTVVNIGQVCALDLRAISSSGVAFQVGQNYPNPSNAQTSIDFSVGFETPTSIVLYNSMGETIQTLIDQPLKAGSYQLDLTTTALPSGVYYYRIMSGPYTETKQMVIAK